MCAVVGDFCSTSWRFGSACTSSGMYVCSFSHSYHDTWSISMWWPYLKLEVCMGIEISGLLLVPWDSRWNGNKTVTHFGNEQNGNCCYGNWSSIVTLTSPYSWCCFQFFHIFTSKWNDYIILSSLLDNMLLLCNYLHFLCVLVYFHFFFTVNLHD